jgi:hypothetical protein
MRKHLGNRNLLPRIVFVVAFVAFLAPSRRQTRPLKCPPDQRQHCTLRAFQSSDFPTEEYHAFQEPFIAYPCQPSRIHIAQSNNADEESNQISMTISFSLPYNQCRSTRATVVYGSGLMPEEFVVAGDPLQFNYTSSKSGGIYQSDWIHHVSLPNLKGGLERYWYRVVVEDRNQEHKSLGTTRRLFSLRGRQHLVGETPPYVFWTPPLPNTPTSLALVGDLGQTENSTRTMGHIWRSTHQNSRYVSGKLPPVSQLLIAGDMSYADSDPYRWTSWMELMEPLTRSLPLHVAAGNHEIECNTDSNDIFVPYEHYFRNPNRVRDAEMQPISEQYRKSLWRESCSTPSAFQGQYIYGNSFYSYDHGSAKIVVLNSYTNATEGSAQYEWTQAELRSTNRTRTPWLIVSFHSPLYTTFLGHVNEIEAVNMKQAMEPLFCLYGVNLVISGHDHAYMRTHSLYEDSVDTEGRSPIYLTLGAGGNREQHSAGYRQDEAETWVAHRTLEDFGYGHLFLANATHAQFRWIRDGTSSFGVNDQVWIKNAHVLS